MTSFEVDDRFAGKKGPCPKCGHIIEIPKEKLVIHAPDEVVTEGKTKKMLGQDARWRYLPSLPDWQRAQ